jgi:hypothetical protein
MYVEILDGQYAGQMREMEPGVAQDLINLGRARKFAQPTSAAPPLPGGYSGAQVAKTPVAPAVVADVLQARLEKVERQIRQDQERQHADGKKKNR